MLFDVISLAGNLAVPESQKEGNVWIGVATCHDGIDPLEGDHTTDDIDTKPNCGGKNHVFVESHGANNSNNGKENPAACHDCRKGVDISLFYNAFSIFIVVDRIEDVEIDRIDEEFRIAQRG